MTRPLQVWRSGAWEVPVHPPGQALALAVLADSPFSISPEATGWLDGEQFVEIEINDRLQCLTGGALA